MLETRRAVRVGDAFEHDLFPLGSRPLIPASHCSERVVTRLVFTAATDLDNLVARLPAVLAAKLFILRHLTLTVIVRTLMPLLRHARSPSAESTFPRSDETHNIGRPAGDRNQALRLARASRLRGASPANSSLPDTVRSQASHSRDIPFSRTGLWLGHSMP